MTRQHWPALFVLTLTTHCDRPTPSTQSAPAASASARIEQLPPLPDAATATSAAPDAGVAAETIGALPSSLEPVVGDWRIGEVGPTKGILVDGSHWRDGTPSADLADQAKRLYGDRYAEFLDGVKAFAFYPLAIRKEPPPTGDIRLSVRFYPLAGKIDQAAGIAFGIGSDGSYFGVRANALEDNLLYFRVVKGKRTVMDTVRNVPTPTRTWHTLVVELKAKKLTVQVDDTKRFEKTLDAIPAGRVGLWSKADSQVLFDRFEVVSP